MTPAQYEEDGALEALNHITRRLLNGEVESAVGDALGVVVQTLGVDRAYVFENRRDGETPISACQRFEFARDPALSQAANADLQEAPYEGFVRWRDRLSQGRAIHGLVSDFPETERELLTPQRIASLVVVPIIVHGTFWGFVGCDQCQEERQWMDREIAMLSVTAHSVGAALLHQRAEAERTPQHPSAGAGVTVDRGERPLLVETATKIVAVSPHDVLWIEADGNYSVLHTAAASYLTRQYLSSLEKRFQPLGFLRVHRSALVALRAIEHLSPAKGGTFDLQLTNGATLRVSRTYASAIREMIL